jgi:hypothetical protein
MENMKRLYAAAESFHKLAPWEWMDDDRIFGVQNPQTGVIDYCGVLGGLGQVFALVVYEGPEGLHDYLKLLSGEIEEKGAYVIEYQRALMASFEDRRELAPEDLAMIRSLNLKFRGKNSWPLFRHYLPGYLPWFVTADQARVLATCLDQALEVLPRYRDNPDLLQDPESGSHLVRVFGSQKGQDGWRDEILPAPAPPPKDSSPAFSVPADEVGIARIRRQQKRRRGVWEIGCCYAPMPIQERRDERPYLPRFLGIVEEGSGLMLAFRLEKPGGHLRAFRDEILSCLERLDFLPERLLVDHDDAAALAEPIAAGLGITLHRVPELPAFAEALDELLHTMK